MDGLRFANWIRRVLLRYRLPRSVQQGPGRKLRVFQDTTYQQASHDFWERHIQPALRSSRFLGRRQWRSVGGVDLKVGGDWAKALYDRALVNFVNRYTRKWGGKVSTTELDTTPSGSLRYEIVDPKGNVQDAFRNRAGAEDAVQGYNEAHRGPGKWTVRDNGTSEKVHSVPITPGREKISSDRGPANREERSEQSVRLVRRY